MRRRGIKRFIIVAVTALVAFVIITCFVTYLAWTSIYSSPGAFFVSLSASFVEEAIFFIIVGLTLATLSLRDPTEEAYETRVRYLFADESLSVENLTYNAKEIERLGCITVDAERSIKVTDFDQCESIFRTEVRSRYVIHNTLTSKPLDINIGPSIASEAAIDRDLHGELISFFSNPESGLSTQHLARILPIGRDGLATEVVIPVPANATQEYVANYWLLNKSDADVYFSPKRFTSRFRCTVENLTEGTIYISLDPQGREVPISIGRGQVITVFDLRHMKPTDFARFWWCDERGHHSGATTITV